MPPIAARTLCTTALELIGVVSAEQPVYAVMAQRALQTLNTMLDAWSTERLLTYTRPTIRLVVVPGRGTYTWGVQAPPADIPREPPVHLELAILLVDETPPGLEWPLAVIDQTAYEAGVWQKTLQSSYPEYIYLEQSQPSNILHIWPVPTLPYTIALFPWQHHAPYASYDAVLDWPAGYQEAFETNLALRLAPFYSVQVAPELRQWADESKRALFPINAEVGRISLVPGRAVGSGGLSYPRGFREGWG